MARRFAGLAGAAVLVVLGIAALGGCREKAPEQRDVYTVRGVVERLPAGQAQDRGIFIHHQAIPEYRDVDGKVVGMASMTMPFPLAAGVSIEGLGPGDAVEFTFAVTWRPRPGYEITRITKLPAGTTVDFSPTH